MQRALIQYRNPKNYDLVVEALHKAHREDLIGYGPKCLVRPDGPWHSKDDAPSGRRHGKGRGSGRGGGKGKGRPSAHAGSTPGGRHGNGSRGGTPTPHGNGTYASRGRHPGRRQGR